LDESQSMNGQRLIELEIKVAFQDDLLQDLNKIVIQQQHQIALLEKTCQLLFERINNLHLDNGDEAIDQTPPHY
jgi:SlyX protein